MTTHSFADLGLSRSLLNAIDRAGYTTPTEVQSRAVPVMLSGSDLLATAQTGTGKTAAFTLPLLQTLGASDGRSRSGRTARPRALVLAPTRELAIQIDESVAAYGHGSGISHLAIFGGAPKPRQLSGLQRNPTVLSATPGRLLDFVSEGAIDLSGVEIFILDEADRMLDMGFIPDVRRIAHRVAQRRQTALFSATMPREIESLAGELLQNPERISVTPKKVTADGIDQRVLHMAQADKLSLLPEIVRDRGMFRVLVFTRTKHRAKKVAKVLNKQGITADELHGNRTQNQRQRALAGFRSGKVHVLVGTDVAARGIDVDDITHVINFEIPTEPETYVHRIGRTARAGSRGVALSFCDAEERSDFTAIERHLKYTLAVDRDHSYHVDQPVGGRPRKGAGHRSKTARPAQSGRSADAGSRGHGGGNARGERNSAGADGSRSRGAGRSGGGAARSGSPAPSGNGRSRSRKPAR